MFPWSWKEGGVMRRRTKRSDVEKGELKGGEEEDGKEGCGGGLGVYQLVWLLCTPNSDTVWPSVQPHRHTDWRRCTVGTTWPDRGWRETLDHRAKLTCNLTPWSLQWLEIWKQKWIDLSERVVSTLFSTNVLFSRQHIHNISARIAVELTLNILNWILCSLPGSVCSCTLITVLWMMHPADSTDIKRLNHSRGIWTFFCTQVLSTCIWIENTACLNTHTHTHTHTQKHTHIESPRLINNE